MGLPALNIVFVSAAKNTIKRSQRGVVGMIIKEATTSVRTNPVVIYKESDIPTELSADSKEQIALALKGNVNAPSKIVVYVLSSGDADYKKALAYFELKRVNWLCCPTIKTDKQEQAVATWVKEQREKRNKVKAVLPNQEADSEGVVNYATDSATIGEKKYTADKFCSRIAGLIAGTPATEATTFSVLPEVSECTVMERSAIDTAVEAGKFMLYYDGEKVKVARGINSLTTTSPDKAEPWKKIKVVEVMDMINDDLTILVEDHYIGKYTNIYDNKCLLLLAVKSYFDELYRGGLLDDYEVDFDVEAIGDYLVEHKGMKREDVEAMKEAEIKKQYTDEKVFLKATVTIADVMEDITLNVAV